MNHADFRAVEAQAFWQRVGRTGTRAELQLCQAVAILETSEGDGWHGAGVGSHNFGGIQDSPSWHGDTFAYTDTHPNADGTSTPYRIAFRKYPTAVAGAVDLVGVVYFGHGRARYLGSGPPLERRDRVLGPASCGDSLGFSQGLYDTLYYEGFGKDPAARVANHHAAVMRALHSMCYALREPLPDGSDPVDDHAHHPTLRLGAHGGLVEHAQEELVRAGYALDPDGAFGPKTLGAVVSFQRSRVMKADGIIGPATWAALEAA